MLLWVVYAVRMYCGRNNFLYLLLQSRASHHRSISTKEEGRLGTNWHIKGFLFIVVSYIMLIFLKNLSLPTNKIWIVYYKISSIKLYIQNRKNIFLLLKKIDIAPLLLTHFLLLCSGYNKFRKRFRVHCN